MAHIVMTDEDILRNHAPGVRPRSRMELKIVNALIQRAAEKGYTLKVWDGYEEEGDSDYDVKTALFNLDLARVEVYSGEEHLGNVLLVFGNSGYDLISDYNLSLEEFLKPVEELADRLEKGLE